MLVCILYHAQDSRAEDSCRHLPSDGGSLRGKIDISAPVWFGSV